MQITNLQSEHRKENSFLFFNTVMFLDQNETFELLKKIFSQKHTENFFPKK